MNIYNKKLIEEYTFQIISRAKSIITRCNSLLSQDFASDAPIRLAETLIKSCEYLEEATIYFYKDIEWSNTKKVEASFTLLQAIDSVVRDIGAHIRYIDGALTQKLPWSFVIPIQKNIKNYLPGTDIEILLRPQWKYNYTIITDNLYDYYYKILSPYELFTKTDLKDVLKISKNFYIISFPTIERKNILLHCLLGHEIGHLASKEFIKRFREKALQNIKNDINPIIVERINARFDEVMNKKKTENGTEIPPLFLHEIKKGLIQEELSRAIRKATKAWENGLEEILSDIIGCILFGPALLFSLLEIALQKSDGLDVKPSDENRYYPPWRMRLREVANIVNDMTVFPLPKDKFKNKNIPQSVSERFDIIKDIVKEETDQKQIETDVTLNISYKYIKEHINEGKKFFIEKYKPLSKDFYNKESDFYEKISHLIERLALGIPPNAYEKSVNEREPVDLTYIFNATWFYKISYTKKLIDEEGNLNEEIKNEQDRMNRLALKAIEYSDIEKKYREEKGIPSRYEVDKL